MIEQNYRRPKSGHPIIASVLLGLCVLACAAFATFATVPNWQTEGQRIRASIVDGMRSSRLGVITPVVHCQLAEGRSCGRGSGVPLGNGVILTADHVVHDALNAFVGATMQDRVPARIMWRAHDSDLALLHAPMFKSAAIPLRCNDAQIGERVTAMGWPLDLGYAEVRARIAGVTQRPWQMRDRYGSVVQEYVGGVQWIDYNYGSGMSGGPTIDEQNRLVGINVLAAQGFGGLVPASEVCRVLGRSS